MSFENNELKKIIFDTLSLFSLSFAENSANNLKTWLELFVSNDEILHIAVNNDCFIVWFDNKQYEKEFVIELIKLFKREIDGVKFEVTQVSNVNSHWFQKEWKYIFGKAGCEIGFIS